MLNKWFSQYEKWLLQCKSELIKKGYTKNQINNSEICENGDIVIHGIDGNSTHKNVVTAWKNSSYFTE